MKILYIIDKLLIYGDCEMNIVALANELSKDNSVYLLTDYYDDDFSKFLGDVEVLVGFEETNYKKLENLGIEIINASPFMIIQIGHELSQRLKTDFYITIHGANVTGLTPDAIKDCNGVVYINEMAKETCQEYVPKDKGFTIYNPVDMTKIPTEAVKNKENDLIIEGYKTIVVATKIDEQRENLLYQLLEISPKLVLDDSGLNIIFIGGGSKLFQMVDVAKRVRSDKVNIRFTGEIDDVYTYFNLADLIVASDRRAIEAILCKKPVFHMGLTKWKELITTENFEQILFTDSITNAYEDEMLTEKLSEILNAPNIEESNELYSKVKDMCSSKVIKEKIENLYKRQSGKD